jgi:Malectin domain/Glycosyl hydrolases family 18/Fibronectin type III domain
MKTNMRPYGWLRQLAVVVTSLVAIIFFGSLASAQQVIAINAGGPAVSPFVADADFSGGATINHANTINTSKVTNPAPAAVYQSARIATTGAPTFTYTIPGLTAGTSFLVRLHFAETFFTTAGSRVFNVSINGTQVLTNFDIVATSGGENIANVQQFTVAANASGQFVITFASVTNNALISGIEIDQTATSGSCQGTCIDSGSTTGVSPFVADMDFSGGATINHANTINTSNVTNPAPQAVYQSARVTTTAGSGSFTYTIPGLTAGTNYLVRLHFAETFWTTAGSRVFNVSINSAQVLTNFDIFAASGGQNIANVQQFTEAANASGQFVITFTSVKDKALISGIEIDPGTGGGSCSTPTAPSGLSATATSSSQINLSWTASSSSCSVSYNVFRSTTSGFTPSSSNQIASGVSSTSFSNTGLAASTTYFYVVEGTNSGGTSAASNQASATTQGGGGGGGGSKQFAPYNDMSLTVSENIVTTAQNAGLKAITLAFLVGNGSCNFGWGGLGGTLPTDNEPNGTTVQSLVHQMQANGVTVIISFGGAQGAIVNGCNNAGALQSSLQGVLNRYSVNMLDFDMEASDTLGDGPGLPVLDQALKGLKAANPNLVISYTLPVLPSGLISSGTAVLNQVHKDGLSLNVVNVMAMDYGSSQDNGGQMGVDAEDAAQAVHGQIQQAGLTSSVGITVMIGQNDTQGEIFHLNDVNTVLNFANANSYVTRLSFWSLARDNGGCAGQTFASPTCSGISQSTYQFSQSFEPF